jgi:hypothetical protein
MRKLVSAIDSGIVRQTRQQSESASLRILLSVQFSLHVEHPHGIGFEIENVSEPGAGGGAKNASVPETTRRLSDVRGATEVEHAKFLAITRLSTADAPFAAFTQAFCSTRHLSL